MTTTTTTTAKQFEAKIESQVNLNKDGIYEVFVNQGEYRSYMNLSSEKIRK